MIEKSKVADKLHFECIGEVDLNEHDGDFEEFLIGEWSFNDIIGKYLGKKIRFEISIQVLNDDLGISSP